MWFLFFLYPLHCCFRCSRSCKLEICHIAFNILVRHRLAILLSAECLHQQPSQRHSMICDSVSHEISVSIFCSDPKVTRTDCIPWMCFPISALLLSSSTNSSQVSYKLAKVWRKSDFHLYDSMTEWKETYAVYFYRTVHIQIIPL